MLDFELNVGWLGDVEDVEKDCLPFRERDSRGRSAGGREETRKGERMIVGRMFESAVGGRAGRGGGLRGLTRLARDLGDVQ